MVLSKSKRDSSARRMTDFSFLYRDEEYGIREWNVASTPLDIVEIGQRAAEYARGWYSELDKKEA